MLYLIVGLDSVHTSLFIVCSTVSLVEEYLYIIMLITQSTKYCNNIYRMQFVPIQEQAAAIGEKPLKRFYGGEGLEV